MAEQRFERDLRSMFAADLDPVHGPHPRWADAPAARRVAASRAAPTRWRMVALLAAAAVGVLALALALAVMPREIPVASSPPTSIEPWPSSISPSATPTAGEIALGQVAVVTANGRPALLVRVSPAADVRGRPGTTYVTIAMRVVGPLDLAVGSDRFVISARLAGGAAGPRGERGRSVGDRGRRAGRHGGHLDRGRPGGGQRVRDRGVPFAGRARRVLVSPAAGDAACVARGPLSDARRLRDREPAAVGGAGAAELRSRGAGCDAVHRPPPAGGHRDRRGTRRFTGRPGPGVERANSAIGSRTSGPSSRPTGRPTSCSSSTWRYGCSSREPCHGGSSRGPSRSWRSTPVAPRVSCR